MDKTLKNADDWCKLLAVEPQYCVIFNDWAQFSIENWVELISAQVQFVSHFDRWDELNSTQIRKLLVLYPALVNKVDVRKIHSLDLVYLLEVHPHFAGIKEINDNMTVDVWHNVIQEGHTEAAIYRKDWENICDDKLLVILKTPEIARQCNTGFWIQALKAQPQFSDQCDKWNDFSADNWSLLLGAQVQFANRKELTAEKIGEFGELEWSRLLPVIEDFEKIRADFGEEIDWDQLVEICPEYLEKYNKRKEQLIAEEKSDESAVMEAVTKCENDVIPYDPPEVKYHSYLLTSIWFRISFSTLTGMTEEMQQKYNINSIKSLCEFDLSTAAAEDKELLGKLQNTWQPGNWLFSNLPCSVLFVNHSDENNIGRLYRAGIKTVGDFMACDDFSKTTLSAENQKACRIFHSRCCEVHIDEFIDSQRILHEKLWEKKLAQYPVTNVIEPNYDFCKFENAPLNSFVQEKNISDPARYELQREYRLIYPNWEKLRFTPDNFINIPGNKKELKKIFCDNIKTLADFLKYDFGVHDELNVNTKRKIKTIQKNIFPVEEPLVDIEQKILEIQSAQDTKAALKIILGNIVEDTYLDSYIESVVEGKTQKEIAKAKEVTGTRIGQIVDEVTDTLLIAVKWWDKYCEEFFSKFGRISAISAVEAKGNALLGNGLGKVIAKCLEKTYKVLGKKVLMDSHVHTAEDLEFLNEQLMSELFSSGKNAITKNEFVDVCFNPLKKYIEGLGFNFDAEYITSESLWDVLKPAGRNTNGGKTVSLMRPGEFIRQQNILNSEPMLRNDIIKAMRRAGFSGCIPENNFASRLDLVVVQQIGKEYKYMLSEQLPELPDGLLSDIADFIKEKLRNINFIDLEEVCNKFSGQLQDITPFMLKGILKKGNILNEVYFDNSSTQIWNKGEIIGLQGLLEEKLKAANKKVLQKELFLIAKNKGYDISSFHNVLNSSGKILTGEDQTGKGLYCWHSDVLKPDIEKLQPIFSAIENETTTVSVKKLFEMHRELCEETGIEDDRLLASILKKCSIYYVDYPTVSLNRELAITLRKMGEDFIKSEKWRSKEDIDQFYNDQHYKSQWSVLQNHPDIFLIAENYVAHRENIGWQDEYGEKLLALANEALNESGKKYMKTGKFVYDLTMGAKKECLPVLENTSWSQALIVGILDKSEKFAVTGCNNCIFFRKEDGLQNFEDLCYLIKKEEKPEDIVAYLSNEKIISESWKYDPANEVFIQKLMER